LSGEAAKQARKRDEEIRCALWRSLIDPVLAKKKLWENPVDVDDTTDVQRRRRSLTLSSNGHCRAVAVRTRNGHYWKQFLSAVHLIRRKLLVLDANDGKKLWSKNANLHESACGCWQRNLCRTRGSFNLQTRQNPKHGRIR